MLGKNEIISAIYACQIGDEYVTLKSIYKYLNLETNGQKAAVRGTLNSDYKHGQRTFLRNPNASGEYKLRSADSIIEDITVGRKERKKIEKAVKKVFEDKDEVKNKALSLVERYELQLKRIALNNDIYTEYLSKLRQHQKDAIDQIGNNYKGQVIQPTGTGKSMVQVAIQLCEMIKNTQNNQFGVYGIAAHRLLLCRQLMDSYNNLKDMCIKCGIPINVLYIGSSRIDDKDVFERYFKDGINPFNYEQFFTTETEKVKDFYEHTMSQNRNLIIVSTYHSFDRMIGIDKIKLFTFDEAHVLSSKDFVENVNLISNRIEKQFFFTATRKVSGEDGGMNDREMYGDILYQVSPSRMIIEGEICKLRIHSIKLLDDYIDEIDKNETMLVSTIIEGFKSHRKKIKEDSYEPDKIGAKILVSTEGTKEMMTIQRNPEFQSFCRNNNIKFFSFSSEYGAFEDFNEVSNRNDAYDHMVGMRNEEDAILLHIDILTEGIDLPSITGVLLLRHLNQIKLFQSIGRALRLLKEDRMRLYSGEIKPEETEKFIKPYAYLILPLHFTEMSSSSDEMRMALEKVIREYLIPKEEFLPHGEEFVGVGKDYLDTITNRDEIHRRNRELPLEHLVYDIVAEEMLANLKIDSIEEYEEFGDVLRNLNKGE